MDSYTTVAQVAAYLNRPLSTNETNALAIVIPAASRIIDKWIGSNFSNLNVTTGVSGRQFRGGYHNINIDPCQNISAVQAINPYDNSVWYTYSSPLEYIAQPFNNTIKTYLELQFNEFTDSNFGTGGRKFPNGDIAIKVTALFTEYDYVNSKYPDDIVMLANHVAAVFMQNNIRADGVLREQIEGHLIQKGFEEMFETDPIIQSVLETRREIWLED